MDVFALSLLLKVEGEMAVEQSLRRLRTAMNTTETEAKGLDRSMMALGGALKGIAAGIGVATVLAKIAAETSDAEYNAAQLNTALRSTRGIARQSAEALNEHAQALARVSVFDDDAITGAQALLLTFTQIRGPVFRDATKAILDVAQAMGTDLRSATIQVGKALNDPILGMTALSRAGIQFTEAQKEAVKQLVETNRLVDAQRIILGELETQFGGSAAAARNTFGGALRALGNELGNLLTLSNDLSTNWLVRFINTLNDAIVSINRELAILGSSVELGVTKVTDAYRKLRAMVTMNAQEFAYFSKSLDDNRRRLEEQNLALRGLDRFGNVLDTTAASSEKAATFMQRMTGSTLAGASAFGLMGDAALRAGQYMQFLTKPSAAAGAGPEIDWDAREKEFDKWMATYREKQRTMARDALAARNIGTVTRDVVAPPAAMTTIGAGAAASMREQVRQSMAVTGKVVDDELATQMKDVRDTFSRGFAEALGAGLANGFQVALSSKSISQGFKALTGTIFSSFGNLLVQFGVKALIASEAIQRMFGFLFTPGPQSALAAAAIIAIGAGLQAAGQGILSSAARGGGSSPIGSYVTGNPAPGGMMGQQLIFGPTSAASASNVSAAAPVNVTIIGTNDPQAQRQMQELIRNAQRRGGITIV